MVMPCYGKGRSSGNTGNALCLGGRYHTDHSIYTDLPFGDGDISYMLAYEYDQHITCWQFGLDYAPEVSGTRDVDSDDAEAEIVGTDFVLTPQFNIIFKDRCFRGGTGIMGSYIRNDDGDGDWIGPYWQLHLGLNFPIGNTISIGGNTYYVVEKWDKIIEFRFDDLEYAVWLNISF